MDKTVTSALSALEGVRDGSTVLVSGFGGAGVPNELLEALIATGADNLTVVTNNPGGGTKGLGGLIATGRVRKIICSYPRVQGAEAFDKLYREGAIELELVPQGTLAERIRAAGAGVFGFYTRTAAGTDLAAGKECRMIDGEECVLETALRADLALVKAEVGDRWGNLLFRKTARNFGPVMCMAAALTVVQVRKVVGAGDLDPEVVVTPGIFVDRVVEISEPSHAA